jgi:hypothetical protein
LILNYVFLFVRIGNSNPDSSSKIGNGAWIQRNEIEMASSKYPSIHWCIIPSIKWPCGGVVTTFSHIFRHRYLEIHGSLFHSLDLLR